MDIAGLLQDLFGRVDEHVHEALDDLAPDHLTAVVGPGTNTIAWLVWHLTRVQDHHVSELLDQDQIWVSGDWGPRFGVSSDPHNTGYGHEADDVTSIRPTSADLLGYHDAVSRRTSEYLHGLSSDDLDRIVDRRWDPPVTLGVRLISIADDDIQHAGQAAFARGILERS
jgi:uncharacterized damage-inducible protein DinB